MPVMFGNGPITLPSLQTPIRCFIVSDSRATPSSTSKVSRSEVPRVIFFDEDMHGVRFCSCLVRVLIKIILVEIVKTLTQNMQKRDLQI